MGHCRFHFLVSLLVLSFCCGSYGQARRQTQPIVSPEVHADGRVTFRLQAPGARSVSLAASFLPETRPLTRDAEGLWSITAGPVSPDIHEYHFIVDGLNIADPRNPDVKVWHRMSRSMVLVPGQVPMCFEEQDVPHGTVRIHRYKSKSLGVTRGLYVYTPAGYETQRDRAYPVLYLLHGSGDTELTWTVVGRANVILDNAIAQKRARPMIVVMPYGHTPGAAPSPSRQRRHEAFETDLMRDVMHDTLKLLWVGCGNRDFLFEANQRFLTRLRADKIEHVARITDGAHEWRLWRRYLNEILPLLFTTNR